MHCSGNSEPNLNKPLSINLHSSLNSNYHTAFSSSTGLSTCLSSLVFPLWNFTWHFSKISNLSFAAQGTTPGSPLSSHPESPTFPSCSSSWSDECTICYENVVDTVLYACGHMCLCYACGLKLKKMANACCPICRRTIKDIIKTYRST